MNILADVWTGVVMTTEWAASNGRRFPDVRRHFNNVGVMLQDDYERRPRIAYTYALDTLSGRLSQTGR